MDHIPGSLVIEEYTSCWEHLCDFGKSIVNNNFYFPHPSGHAIKAQLKIGSVTVRIPAVNNRKILIICHILFGYMMFLLKLIIIT